jgi:3-isopropylmalate/(R)-2-methylmalate dehydratase small subunit
VFLSKFVVGRVDTL